MTRFERRQLHNERNRLRRMHQIVLDRCIEANNKEAEFLEDWEPPQIEDARKLRRRACRYFALQDLVRHRLEEISNLLGTWATH